MPFCLVWSGLAYEIYNGGGPSTYVYCVVCYCVIVAPYVRSVGHVFAYLYTLDDDSERPMDYETSLLPKVFPFDLQSIDATFGTFEQFQAISGLKANFNMKEIFPLGPLKETKMSLYNIGKVKCSQDGVKALGIHITHDSKTLIAKNIIPL